MASATDHPETSPHDTELPAIFNGIVLTLAQARDLARAQAVITEHLLTALGAHGGGLVLYASDETSAQPGESAPLSNQHNRAIHPEDGADQVGLVVPVCDGEQTLGHIEAVFAPGHDLTGVEPLLSLVAQHCAAAVVRAREYERLNAELAQRETSEARLRATVEMLPIGVWLTDTEGTILVDNPAGQQIWGTRFQGREHLGAARAWWADSGEPVRPEDWSLARALRTGEPVLDENIKIESADGSRRSIRSSALPVRDETGAVCGVLVLNEDVSTLRAAQAAYRASEERLRLAADVAGFGAYDDHGDGNVFWSSELKAIFGLDPDAEITSGVEAALARIHPDDRERWLQALAAARDPQGTGELEIEHRILRPEGTIAWVVQKGRILFEGEGPARRPVRAIGLALDITARKQAEERQRFLADLSETIRRIDDPDALLGAVTHALGAFLGVARCLFDEVDLDADREIVREDYRSGVASVVGEHRLSDYSPVATQDMVAGRTVVNHDAMLDPRTADLYETTYGPANERAYVAVPLLRDGRWVATLWVSTATPRTWTADEVSLLEMVAERTWLAVEKARTERALRESEERFAKAFAASPHLVSISSLADGRYLDVNDAVLRATGYTREEMIGRTSTELGIFPYPEGRERLVQALKEGGGSVRNLEIELRGKDGSVQTVLLSAETVTIGGQPCILTTSNDITERKRMEEALRASEAQLARELADTTRLQQISSQLLQEDQIDALYEQILDAAIAVMRSNMGSIQMLYPKRNELRLLAWRGFDPASAAFWEWVGIDSASTCGVALHRGERVHVPDIEACDFMAGTDELEFYRRSGIRAVQSTPLITRGGRLVGMISTHWREPHQPAERELRLFDVLARQAADLLERKQAEAALQRQIALIDQAYDPVIVWELEDGIVYWNHAAEQFYGYSAAEALGKMPHVLLHTRRSIPVPEFTALLLREGRWSGEVMHTTRDGRQVVIETRHVLMEEPGGQRLVLQTNHDVTEQRRAEEERARLYVAEQQARAEAEANAARVQRLQDITAALTTALTPEQVARVVVEQVASTVGASGGAVRLLAADGATLEIVASENLHPASVAHLRPATLSGRTPAADAARTGEAGFYESKEAILTAYPHLADELAATGYEAGVQAPLLVEGRVLGVLGLHFSAPRRLGPEDRELIRTIAHLCAQALERARLYQVEQEARTRAEHAIKMREHVLATVTHDLRNPLATIKGSAQMLQRQLARLGPVEGLQQLATSAQRIESAASKMNLMMEDLLDAARLQRGEPLELRLQPTDLASLVLAAAENLRQTAARHQVQVHHTGEPLTGEWDAIRLERVIDNLLSNAVKYSPEGGPITLSLQQEQGEGQSWAVFTVEDRGLGIPAADLPYIFQHFRRGANVTGLIAGTGIGLAGAKQIVEQHGGSISASSREGEGTTVTLRLPVVGGNGQ